MRAAMNRLARAARRRDIPTGVVVIVAVLFLNNFAAAASRPLLPVYVERELGFAPGFSATLLALETAVGGVISLFAGALADRVGHKPVLLLGFLGFMAGLLQFTTAVPWLLVTLALLLGLGHGLRSTAGQSYLLSAARPGSVGVATAAFFLGGTIGSALGAALAGGIIEAYGFATFALVGLVLSLAPIGLALWKLPPVARHAAAGRSLGSFRGFWAIVSRREILLLGGLRFFPTAFWGVFTLALPLLIFRATDSVLAAALYATVGLILSTVSQFSVGRWSDRHGRRRPTYLFLLGLVAAAGLAAVGHGSAPLLFVAGSLGTVSGWTMSVLVLGAVRERTSDAERGRVVGFIHALWSFGLLTGTIVAGVLLDVNPALPLGLAAVFGVVALGFAVVLYKRGPAARHPAPAG